MESSFEKKLRVSPQHHRKCLQHVGQISQDFKSPKPIEEYSLDWNEIKQKIYNWLTHQVAILKIYFSFDVIAEPKTLKPVDL